MADFSMTPVATGIKPPEPVRLADMINMASAAQQYQQQQKLNPLALQSAEQQVEQAKIGTQKAGMGLAADRMKAITDSQISMITNPLVNQAAQDPNSVDKNALKELIKNNGYQTADALGIPKDQADKLIAPYLQVAESNPAAVKDYFIQRHIQGLDAASKTSAMTPTMREVTGFAPGGEKVTQQVNVNPFAGPIGAPIGGTTSFAGTPIISQPTGNKDAQGNPTAWELNPKTGTIREVTIPAGGMGAAGGGDLNKPIGAGSPGAAAGGPPPPIPAGEEFGGKPQRISPAEEAMRDISFKTAQQDWNQTIANNQAAQSRIASFQKIKSLVPDAFTGVGSDRARMVSSLAQTLNLPVNVLETASAEELAKNSALLQLAGGNTDAARAIAELANPNTKMTKEGILRVTDQLIGLERMNQAKAQFLAPYQSDANTYMRGKSAFDQYADPRMFQESTPEEVQKMKAAMSPKEREEFANKVKMARQLGII